MIERRLTFKGNLKGHTLLGSIDKLGERLDKTGAIQVVRKGEHVKRGYRGYIFEEIEPKESENLLDQGIPYITGVDECNELLDFDIVSVNDRGIIRVLHRIDSDDNIIFITNNCNSNCIMCPEAEAQRRSKQVIDLEYLKEYVSLIPDDARYLTITGGEPTLIKEGLLEILKLCQERFYETHFLLLTNGRTFAIKKYAEEFLNVLPRYIRVAIPIYSSNPEKHDRITRVPRSFIQAKKGIEHIGRNVEVEVRVVVMKENYKDLPGLAQMIVEELPYVHTVSFMGLELLGNAAINKEDVWVDYEKSMPYVEEAIITLIKKGIEANIYNYPLCSIPERLWSISKKSISDYKVRFKEECESCSVKSQCGGFFFSTIQYDKIRVKPV